MQKKTQNKTSWGNVAGWYDNLLKKENTYQSDVILPNLLKLMNIKNSDIVLDLACGQGFFAREFAKFGARVTGIDISKELIKVAEEQNKHPSQMKSQSDGAGNIRYVVSSADNISFIKDKSVDKISIILALQNIDNLSGVVKECYRVLKSNGKLFMVLNHPAFRIPRKSDWGYDDKKKVQYRKIEKYLSEFMMNIDMNPGEKIQKNKKYTVSFHRPLQTYFKSLNSSGFFVSRFEEWISDKKSQSGPKQKMEDMARKEIPMFACIEAVKISM